MGLSCAVFMAFAETMRGEVWNAMPTETMRRKTTVCVFLFPSKKNPKNTRFTRVDPEHINVLKAANNSFRLIPDPAPEACSEKLSKLQGFGMCLSAAIVLTWLVTPGALIQRAYQNTLFHSLDFERY